MEVLAKRHPARRAAPDLGLRLGEPEQARRQVGRVQEAARARVHRVLVQSGAQLCRGGTCARIGPRVQRRDGSAARVHAEHTVPERAGRHAGNRLAGRHAWQESVDGAHGVGKKRLGVELDPAVGRDVRTVRDLHLRVRQGRSLRAVEHGAQ